MRWYICALSLALTACATATFEDAQKDAQASNYEKAAGEFKKLSDKGDPRAMYMLGIMEMQGLGVKRDYAKALTLLNQAAERDIPPAEMAAAGLYQNGWGTEEDDYKSAALCRKAAEQGFTPAKTCLGYDYLLGKGVPRDTETALQWLTQASDEGDALAPAYVGYTYGMGIEVKKDPVAAMKWYELAAKRGNFEAQLFVGASYEQGVGVPKDQVQADEAFKMAAARPISSVDEMSIAMKAIINAHSAYPPDAVTAHREGDVTVSFDYKDQLPWNIHVDKTSGDKELDRAAMVAVQKSLFPKRPAQMQNVTHFVVIVNFNAQHHGITPPGANLPA